MKKISLWTLFLSIVISSNSFAEKRDYHYIKQAAENWALAVSSGDLDEIMDHYDGTALLGTNCKHFFNTQEKIKNYYRQLIKHEHLEVQFNDPDIRISPSGKAATHSGIYVFTYQEHGQTKSTHAQYTLSYAKDPNDRWLIIAHHSSFMP